MQLHELSELKGLIGLRVTCRGHECQIIDVLEDEPAVVLRCSDETVEIQADQYGSASRRVPPTTTIPIFQDSGVELHPDFLALELLPID